MNESLSEIEEKLFFKARTFEKLSKEIIKINQKHLMVIDKIKVLEKNLARLEVYCQKFLNPQPLSFVILRELGERLHLIRQIKNIQGQIFLLRSDLEELDNDFEVLCNYCIKLLKDEELPIFPYKYASILIEEL